MGHLSRRGQYLRLRRPPTIHACALSGDSARTRRDPQFRTKLRPRRPRRANRELADSLHGSDLHAQRSSAAAPARGARVSSWLRLCEAAGGRRHQGRGCLGPRARPRDRPGAVQGLYPAHAPGGSSGGDRVRRSRRGDTRRAPRSWGRPKRRSRRGAVGWALFRVHVPDLLQDQRPLQARRRAAHCAS